MDSSVPIVNQNQSTQPLQLQPAMLTQAWPAGTQQILIPSSWQQVPGVAIHGSTHQSVVTESPVETLLPDTGQQTHSWRGSQYSGMLQQNLGVNSRSGARKRAKGSRGNSRTTRGVSGVSRLTNAVLQFSLSQSSSWTRPARRSASSPSSQMRRTRGSSTPPVQPQTSYINPKLANRHPCSSGDGSNRHRLVPSQSHPLNLSQPVVSSSSSQDCSHGNLRRQATYPPDPTSHYTFQEVPSLSSAPSLYTFPASAALASASQLLVRGHPSTYAPPTVPCGTSGLVRRDAGTGKESSVGVVMGLPAVYQHQFTTGSLSVTPRAETYSAYQLSPRRLGPLLMMRDDTGCREGVGKGWER
ncbi:homeodomain-interacting protein kinase 1-like isoform X2 [Oncorhynchus kisutch]|uniref:homeodomain-interacting protein kinase 1-like isoform X2 n=1 Tax=Oncorhynchus kisutch TaxID=8019 RepID=UPI0012DDA8F7|nr:homeodomain-interacting protein kinase 1-like isoform X2 [Oncorhynchus kisutch]